MPWDEHRQAELPMEVKKKNLKGALDYQPENDVYSNVQTGRRGARW